MYMYSGITSGRVLKGGVGGGGGGGQLNMNVMQVIGDISLYGKIPLDVMCRPILYSTYVFKVTYKPNGLGHIVCCS